MNQIRKNEQIRTIRIALAGNPNVGKSVIFNQLTGMSQVVGNWPGKTVAKAEGYCKFINYNFQIIDLPGIYSLSTYSLEEIITREYIVEEKPDYIINVVDANQLERNLFFTLQLKMLNRPMIMALNQYDLLKKRGYSIDTETLEDKLGVQVQKVVAVHNRGVHELLERIIELEEDQQKHQPPEVKFGQEIETQIQKIIGLLKDNDITTNYPHKFAALKLLENDDHMKEHLKSRNEQELDSLTYFLSELRENLQNLHGEQISTILNAELYRIAFDIFQNVQSIKEQSKKYQIRNFIDHITIHSVWGYLVLAIIMFGSYFLVFSFGDWVSGLIDGIYQNFSNEAQNLLGGEGSWLYKLIWNGFMGGLVAGVGGVLPFVIPFYFIIEILQDIGYLPRAAYLMDRFMHKIGVHGKTIIPVLLGFGCTVPAISACRIMETEEQRRRSILISSMIPCSATTTIVMGLVAENLNMWYALLLYVFLLSIIIAIGKVLTILSDTDDSELIIELHDFRKPNFKVITKQAWFRSKEFVYMALPLMIGLGVILQIIVEFQALDWLNSLLSPVTVHFLGLPVGIGVYLIYGFLRKELNLVLLEIFVVSQGLTITEYLSPLQMIVFTLVTLLYIPCLATFINIRKEAGRKFAWHLFFFRLILAILIAGSVYWSFRLVDLSIPQLSFSLKMIGTLLIFGLILLGIIKIIHHHAVHHDNNLHLTPKEFREFSEIDSCATCKFGKRCPKNSKVSQCKEFEKK